MIKIHRQWLACAALAAAAMPLSTMAQSRPTGLGLSAPYSAVFANPVAPEALERLRGGTEVVKNDMALTGAVTGNTAVNVATGSNAINAGSFANMTGLPVVIQNTGANVLIQSALIVNLQIN